MSKRTTQVRVWKVLTDSYSIAKGTPQGRVISLTTFNIMINDLPESVRAGTGAILSADYCAMRVKDGRITVAGERTNEAFRVVSDWAAD